MMTDEVDRAKEYLDKLTPEELLAELESGGCGAFCDELCRRAAASLREAEAADQINGEALATLQRERDEAIVECRKAEHLWKRATIDRDAALRDIARATQERVDYAIRERDEALALLKEARAAMPCCHAQEAVCDRIDAALGSGHE